MRVPLSTYRIQFNQAFRFADGRDLAPYLHKLGIGDMYSSPWFKARRGSSHGYDIADPTRINSELGADEEFEEMAEKLRHYGMGLLLDWVPNHMAASSENPWWMDVLENGPASEYAEFFDIDWHPARGKAEFLQDNRVLLPILGDLYDNVLSNQELVVHVDDMGLFLRYNDNRLPLDPKTYGAVIGRALEIDPSLDQLRAILAEIDGIPARSETGAGPVETRRQLSKALKQRLWRAYFDSPEVKHALDEAIRVINGSKDDPRSFDALDALLTGQAYRVAHWRIAFEEINYRRFFDVNDLVGLRVEISKVFAASHKRLLEVVRNARVTGLRIDYVDGLWDPLGYVERLQESLDGTGGSYIVLEKILGADERLRADWPVAGTTGYEFMNALNGIFVHPRGLEALAEGYARRTHLTEPFEEVCYAANKKVMGDLFIGEIRAMGCDLGRLAALDRQARDVPIAELIEALMEVTARLPVYRTYIRDFEMSDSDRGYIERTIRVARERTPAENVSPAAFTFLRRVLLLDPPYYAEEHRGQMLAFVMRWQQFTGPVMAKGLEDTAYYRYNALISLNEVGGDPLRVKPPMDLVGFHEFNMWRQQCWAGSLSATFTHDAKRGEDARARINVLSEIPREWEEQFDRWSRLNEPLKKKVGGTVAPDPNDEFLIYQTLLGTWPNDEAEQNDYPARLRDFFVKAAREAKQRTSWLRPDANYEQALDAFTSGLLAADGKFQDSFLPFQKKVAFYGAVNGLSQVLLKIACPGVPDFYQGTELWSFSMVDPDNRRPVDYRLRAALLDWLRGRESEDRTVLAADLAREPQKDAAKMYVVWKALGFRRDHATLFSEGDYIPVAAVGAHSDCIVTFARRRGSEWALAVAPRWITQLDCTPPDLSSCNWGDTALQLPPGAPENWTNIFTGVTGKASALCEILHDFPVALLEGRSFCEDEPGRAIVVP